MIYKGLFKEPLMFHVSTSTHVKKCTTSQNRNSALDFFLKICVMMVGGGGNVIQSWDKNELEPKKNKKKTNSTSCSKCSKM